MKRTVTIKGESKDIKLEITAKIVSDGLTRGRGGLCSRQTG